MTVRLFVSAGEASGDRHAASLVRALRARIPDLELRGLGGPALLAEGTTLLAHLDELSALGFSEVLHRLPFFLRLLRRARAEIEAWRPHLVLPVDYPGFNLRLARSVRSRGFRVVYYIAPQVWAWRAERRAGIARAVDHLMVVFPFEEPLFRAGDIPTTFVGHPLLDASPGPPREHIRGGMNVGAGDRLLALLPGSRTQEVRAILPVLVAGASRAAAETGAKVVVSRAPVLSDRQFLPARAAGFQVWDGPAAHLARAADAALVASGTATLETGLQGTPLAVVYRTGALNWQLAKVLVKLRTVGLVNIAAGGTRVPELLQKDLTPERVAEVAERLLTDPREAAEQRHYLAGLRERLGGEGAAERAAALLAGMLGRPAPG